MKFDELKPDGPISLLHKTLQDLFLNLPRNPVDDLEVEDIFESVTIDIKSYADDFPLGLPNNIGSFYLERIGATIYRVSKRNTPAD